jgi:hypothetical protein
VRSAEGVVQDSFGRSPGNGAKSDHALKVRFNLASIPVVEISKEYGLDLNTSDNSCICVVTRFQR